jgi:MFS family permease
MQKRRFWEAKTPKANRRLVIAETAITSSILSMAIMVPFFNSIGMNQEQIALSQMVFTVVAMVLNVPMGWVADKFSRKWANIIGDLLCATALFLYSFANSIYDVIACESLFGIACALSQGVDSSLLKHFADKDDSSGKLFKRSFSFSRGLVEIVEVIVLLIGTPIGAISFRLAIRLSMISYLIGAILSFCVYDDSPKLVSKQKNPFRDMGSITKRCLKDSSMRLRIVAYALSREITHGLIWVFTPLLALAGVPLVIVGFGWVVNSVMGFIGTKLAARYGSKLSDAKIFAIPIVLATVAGSIMFFNLNIITVWLYGIFGLVRGWNGATMITLVKERAKPSEQATVESIARVVSQLTYIVTTYFINRAADIELRYSLATALILFVPLAIPVAFKLRSDNSRKYRVNSED